MLKGLLVSAAIVGLGLATVSAHAESLQTGRGSTMRHHHSHMMVSRHHNRGVSYGVGSRNPRTTATGGNAGGYSNRN